jgi:hypothetical protein
VAGFAGCQIIETITCADDPQALLMMIKVDIKHLNFAGQHAVCCKEASLSPPVSAIPPMRIRKPNLRYELTKLIPIGLLLQVV